MKPETLLMLSVGALTVAGVAIYRSQSSASSAPGETVIVNHAAKEQPNVPWQNKLPSDYEASSYVFNFGPQAARTASNFGDFLLSLTLPSITFGGSAMGDIILGDMNLGDTILNMPIVEGSSGGGNCNMCQTAPETAQPLLPYAPVVQQQELAPAPVPTEPIVSAVANGRNTVKPLISMTRGPSIGGGRSSRLFKTNW